MRPIRIQLRTIMIGIAALALLLGAVRFVLWLHEGLGIEILVIVASYVVIFLFIPLVTIVEILFFGFYFWRRRKPAGQSRRIAKMPAGTASRPLRRFLRFSVLGLVVLVLVIGRWLGWIVRSARIQHEAVAAINKGGGIAHYDDYGQWINSKPWPPNWLARTIGVDYFADVKDVTLLEPSDDTLRHVGQLRQIQTLELVHLLGFSLGESEITDAGMVYLKDLTALTKLDLLCSRITDAGLVHLTGLTNLSELSILPSVMTDTEIAQLPQLALKEFNGFHVQVTDAGLVHLSCLSNLSRLNLMGNRVTDVGLVHLKGLKKLSYLDLRGNQVTDAGVEELQKALPSLTIVR